MRTLPAVTVVFGAWLLALGSVPAAAQVVAAWDFDDVQGAVVPDRSGLGNDLTVRLGTLVKGVHGKALALEGNGTGALCLGASGGSAGPGLTLEAWLRPGDSQPASFPALVRKEGHYALRFSGNRLGLLVWSGGAPQSVNSTRTDWPAGQWLHVAGTCDGTTLRLYVNGVLDASATPGVPLPVEAAPLQCFVGCGMSGYNLRGELDEVRILSQALSAEDVRQRYEAGLAWLKQEREVTVTPQDIGRAPAPFRKPPREVKMVQPGFLWVEAEDFADYGGWTLDTQYVHFMGSAYLLASGVGKSVADARTEVTLPTAGRYRLWVRCRNWLPEFSPGQFAVLANGQVVARTFGRDPGSEWRWEDGGVVALNAGPNTLALHDLTGYYGRCDALLLTSDQDYRPPTKLDAVTQERARLTGLSLVPQPRGEYDVIVVGAGAAGCCAAIAAARNGARTALVQDRPVLGGNSSTEAGVPINGAGSCHPNAREGGIIEEAGRVKARNGYPQMSQAFADVAAMEPNLTVLCNQRVTAVRMQDAATIAAVQATDTLSGAISEYRARLFIDCTGDGWVGYYAGAKFRLGREPGSEYNESLAPKVSDNITMSGCLMGGNALGYRAVDTGQAAPYAPPPWAPTFTSMTGYGRQVEHVAGGNWWMEHRGTVDDLWNPEVARDELIRITYGYWDYVKNRWEDRAKAANFALAFVPILDAKRETRRLLGDYVLNQNDCQAGRVFPDAISYGGWPLDVHHPEGIYSSPEAGAFDTNTHVPIYTIPFRCLYSANLRNLLMAGRDISVSHIALGTVRVQGTLAPLGQAAGTAAALAVRHQTTPRGIYQQHLAELQRVLVQQDQHIPGLAVPDPDNLARQASEVACSSQADYELFRREEVQPDKAHELTVDRAVVLPVGTAPRALELLLQSKLDQPLDLALHIAPVTDSKRLQTTATEGFTTSASVPPGEHWVRFSLPRWVETPCVALWLPATPGVSWRLMKTAPAGAQRAYGSAASGQWTVLAGQYYAFCADPPWRSPADFAVRHLNDGQTRPDASGAGLWTSDPAQPLPQWAELRFAQPVTAHRVQLTFDTDVNAPYHDVALVPQCVRDYEVTAFDGHEWRSLAKVTGNFQRHRCHDFPPLALTKLRVTVTATNGAASARVYEVKLY